MVTVGRLSAIDWAGETYLLSVLCKNVSLIIVNVHTRCKIAFLFVGIFLLGYCKLILL